MTAPIPMPRWMKWLETHRAPFCREGMLDTLHLLGFWDMADGDYYVNGRWNWRCWEMWDRHNARCVAWDEGGRTLGDMSDNWMPTVPRVLKRVFA